MSGLGLLPGGAGGTSTSYLVHETVGLHVAQRALFSLYNILNLGRPRQTTPTDDPAPNIGKLEEADGPIGGLVRYTSDRGSTRSGSSTQRRRLVSGREGGGEMAVGDGRTFLKARWCKRTGYRRLIKGAGERRVRRESELRRRDKKGLNWAHWKRGSLQKLGLGLVTGQLLCKGSDPGGFLKGRPSEG
jgi:hypothetical protein